MFEVKQAESLKEIKQLRENYINGLPYSQELHLEEMIRKCDYYLINDGSDTIGYFCVKPDKVLYEFYLKKHVLVSAQEIFKTLIEKGYFVAAESKSFDNLLMSLCLDFNKKAYCTAYLFREYNNKECLLSGFDNISFRLAVPEDYKNIIEISGNFFDDLKESISSGEVFVLYENSCLLGAGSCKRVCDGSNYYDIGMVVSENFRNRGLGSYIIKELRSYCCATGKLPVCGCWYYNYASRKALEKAGFITKHRIVKFEF